MTVLVPGYRTVAVVMRRAAGRGPRPVSVEHRWSRGTEGARARSCLACAERGHPVMVRCLLVPAGRSQEGRNTRRERMAEKGMPAAERQRETRPACRLLPGRGLDNRPDTGCCRARKGADASQVSL